MKRKLLSVLLIGVLVTGLTGCGSNQNKMVKLLRNQGYSCPNGSEKMICEKEENNKKRIFELDEETVNYEELIYDSGTVRLQIKISNTNYRERTHYYGIIKAYFKGEDLIEFYPENCTDKMIDCHLHVGERVYPELKEKYDSYKEYFESGKYREYLNLKNKHNKSLSDEYREFSLETTFEINSEIKDKDQFTENVNDALRFYEKTLLDAGITLGK